MIIIGYAFKKKFIHLYRNPLLCYYTLLHRPQYRPMGGAVELFQAVKQRDVYSSKSSALICVYYDSVSAHVCMEQSAGTNVLHVWGNLYLSGQCGI